MSRGVEALFIPGQQLSVEAESVMQQIRNCGARLNRLKLARASPDAPMWWQFLSSADGSSESLDRSAFDLHCVLRDLEQANSDLKRLCVAPASDVAGNVQHEMAKKRWAMSTLDRWATVLKSATVHRAEAEAGKMRDAQQNPPEQKPMKHGRSSGASKSAGVAASSLVSGGGGGDLPAFALMSKSEKEQHQQREEQEQRRSQALMAMSPQRQQLIKSVLDAQERVETKQEELDSFDSNHTSSLRLAEKFRELEQLETRFANVRTRRRQFQAQVQAHLQGMAGEIEKEANARRQRGRELYDENHPADMKPTEEEQEELRLVKERQRRRKLRGHRSGGGGNQHNSSSSGGNDNNPSFSADGEAAVVDEDEDAFFCDDCRDCYKEVGSLEAQRRSKWVNRAVRVLCTQTVDPAQLRQDARSVVPTQRLLAVIGSRKEDGAPAVIMPLVSRKDRQQQQRGGVDSSFATNRSVVPALSSDGRDAVWQIPSAHDHSKYWTVHLAI